MKFKVRISELRYGEMDVIAASEEEAREIAEKNPGDVTWVDSETTDMTVEDQPTKPVAPVPEDRSCQRISPNIIQMSGSPGEQGRGRGACSKQFRGDERESCERNPPDVSRNFPHLSENLRE